MIPLITDILKDIKEKDYSITIHKSTAMGPTELMNINAQTKINGADIKPLNFCNIYEFEKGKK